MKICLLIIYMNRNYKIIPYVAYYLHSKYDNDKLKKNKKLVSGCHLAVQSVMSGSP